jgi:hypothetical protein
MRISAFPRTGFYPDTQGPLTNEAVLEMLPTVTEPQAGMDLRDYFAARAMQGELANLRNLANIANGDTMLAVATYCYQMADKMMEARQR